MSIRMSMSMSMKRRRSSTATTASASMTTRQPLSSPSSAAADAVVAATAGEDSWKTWAGRSHGSSEFEWMDLFRGSKRTLKCVLLGGTGTILPPPGATCPVCYCEPEVWHVTASCSHAVCLDCLRGYAKSQVQDPAHSGPLKCPVCPQALRRKDAVIALLQPQTQRDGDGGGGGDGSEHTNTLIRQWDEKIRNQLLRALPSYRPCPNCSAKSSSNTGGGFVTPECLAPQYQQRRDEASKVLRQGTGMAIGGVSLAYIVIATYISNVPSSSPLVDLFFLLWVPFLAARPNFLLARRLAAQHARDALFRPISVECPCCQDHCSFILPNTAADLVDAESKQWMERHARACPSCSAPISKQGGCNHMQCPNCHASFCWACMQLRSACRAYQCTNGARFGGNAVPGQNGDTIANDRVQDSLLNRIDSILDTTTPSSTSTSSRTTTSGTQQQPPPFFPYCYFCWQNGLVLMGLLTRSSRWVQTVIDPLMTLVVAIFASGLSSWIVVGVTSWNAYRQWLDQRRRQQQQQQRGGGQQQQQQQQQTWEQVFRQLIATTTTTATTAAAAPQARGGGRGPLTASEFLLLGAEERNNNSGRWRGRSGGAGAGAGGGQDQEEEVPRMIFRTEEEMIREAMRRSLQER